MIELLTGWLGGLKNADHVGVTMQINDTIKEANIENKTYKTAAAALAKAIADEDDAYRKTQKDWIVEELRTVDERLDNYMKGLRQIVSGHATMPNEERLTQTAKEMLQIWKDYDFHTNDSYTGESAKVINMFQEVERRKTDAEALGIWGYFEQAKEQAEKIQQLLGERVAGLATRVAGELRMARAATDAAVKEMYRVVESLQMLDPSATVTDLARNLRALEDYARQYYLKLPASTADDKPTVPGTEPDKGESDSGTPPMGGD